MTCSENIEKIDAYLSDVIEEELVDDFERFRAWQAERYPKKLILIRWYSRRPTDYI